MEADTRLNLGLLHLVGIGERETTKHVNAGSLDSDVTCGYSTVTLQLGKEVAYLHLFIFTLCYLGSDVTNRQLATLQLTHLGCSRFRDVKLKVGLAGYLTQVGHIHRLA